MDKMMRNDQKDNAKRQWERITAFAKSAGFSREQEGSRYRPHDIVLHLADPPSPTARRHDEFYRARAADESQRQKLALMRALQATAPDNCRRIYLDDPSLPYPDRFIPITRR